MATPRTSGLAPRTFLSHHGHVLACIARDPEIRISEIAELVGVGQRATQSIVNDLVDADYLTRTRIGRRNRYSINTDRRLHHPPERSIGDLIAAIS